MDYVNYYHFVTRSRASLRGYATLIASKLRTTLIELLIRLELIFYPSIDEIWMEYRIISKKKKNINSRFRSDKNDFTILKLLSSFIFEFIIYRSM